MKICRKCNTVHTADIYLSDKKHFCPEDGSELEKLLIINDRFQIEELVIIATRIGFIRFLDDQRMSQNN